MEKSVALFHSKNNQNLCEKYSKSIDKAKMMWYNGSAIKKIRRFNMNCEIEIKKVLKKIGITPELNGYHYLEKCIIEVKKCLEDGKTPCGFYQMYKDVAKLFDVTPTSVERCMRHAKMRQNH